jgi:la-related protein 1
LPKEDDISFIPNGSSDSAWDKQSQGSGPTEKPNQTPEANKDKPLENGWDKGGNGSKLLKAAPIPTVNVWQQRREAQEKARANASKAPTAAPSKSPTAKPSAVLPAETRSDGSKAGSRKKAASSSETTLEGSGPQARERRKLAEGGKAKDDGRSSLYLGGIWSH